MNPTLFRLCFRYFLSKLTDIIIRLKWNSKAFKYDYIGDAPEPLEINFNDLFKSKTKVRSNLLESEIAVTNERIGRIFDFVVFSIRQNFDN